jgi:hypothetical protein
MANDIDAYDDLGLALLLSDKKGYKQIVEEIKRGDYGEEAKGLLILKEKQCKRKDGLQKKVKR